MFLAFLRMLIVTLVIVAAYTLPELAPVAQVLTYLLWPVTVIVICWAVFDREGQARKQLELPRLPAGRLRPLRIALAWAMQGAQALAIAYSGRPALAAAVVFMFFAFAYVNARERELREEQDKQGLPPSQVKCPGHR